MYQSRSCVFSLLLISVFVFVSCNKHNTLFEKIGSNHSDIHFNNLITESDSVNPIKLEFLYNGGGVAVGDFNNDGLQDLYFTGSQVSNKLYLNKGNFKFEDVTDKAGVEGKGRWSNAASVIDINNDGLLDIYVCATIKANSNERKNLLYINQGVNKDHVPIFKDMSEEYHLADTGYSVHAVFFDYDNDGDLDMYLLRTQLSDRFPGIFRPIIKDGTSGNNDKLFRNDWDSTLNHPVFTDVSKDAGIVWEGYGLGINIVDINKDGWKDIYVTNDFVGDDLLYINNKNGTFTNKAHDYFKHTSANAMGNDVADINNDGLADFVSVDMNPEDNFRKKMMMDANKYQQYQNILDYNYMLQYVKNTLQLNMGPSVFQNDSIGDPVFSEIGFQAGIAQTDWSWSPLFADMDNDGLRDLLITNGYPKDVTDHDFVTYRRNNGRFTSGLALSEMVPQVKVPNYAFKNNGDLTFSNVGTNWGLAQPDFSNGAVYVDLDNDGDLDYVVNNINDEASVYKNNEQENDKEKNHYLNIKFNGAALNKDGIGAIAELHYNHGKQQVYENSPYRGYLSTIQNTAHFGLGKIQVIDSVLIKWQDGKTELLQNVKADQLLTVQISNAQFAAPTLPNLIATNSLFREISDSLNIHYTHTQTDFIDFNIQKLLPHKFSEYGPGLAVGDIDGNGLDDIISAGSSKNNTVVFLQQSNGKFIQRNLLSNKNLLSKLSSDMGLLLFDADGDGDLDLYSSCGGFEGESNSPIYQDHFYVNDGKGNFTSDTTALPKNFTSKFCVRAIDFDKDGDLDLFVAGRVDPWKYPKPVSSFIFRNDSKNGHIQFTDVTTTVAKDLVNIGLTCDAVFTDFDNDGWPDLVLAGEWMPVTFLKNDKGIFKNVTNNTGINNQLGWWNTIAAGDFDNDGDIDYVVGNLGTNSFYKASTEYPVYIIAKDFDNNGSFDAFPSLYLTATDGTKKEFPAQTRDDIVKQMIGMRAKFQNYNSFATATMDKVITEEQRKGALRLMANNLQSVYIRNDGNGKFSMTPLPALAQIAVLNGMDVADYDGDGNLDVAITGNDFGVEVSQGRSDALYGLLLKGDGKGNFAPLSILQSGIFIPGNGKALVKLRGKGGKYMLAASQNRGALKVFELKKDGIEIPVKPYEVSASIKYKNGKTRKEEFYFGASFLSQSSRFLYADNLMSSLTIFDQNGKGRSIILP